MPEDQSALPPEPLESVPCTELFLTLVEKRSVVPQPVTVNPSSPIQPLSAPTASQSR